MVKSHPVGTNGPWVLTPAIRSSSASERKKMMLIHANLSKIDDLTWTFWLSWHRFFREMAPLLEWPWNRRKSAGSDSQWPVDTGRGAVAPVAGPRLVTGGLGRQPKAWAGNGGSLNSCFKIFDKFAWISIIFFLSEPDDDLIVGVTAHGLLAPAGWSPGWLKLLFTVFFWRIFPGNCTAVCMALKSAKTRRIQSSMACWCWPGGLQVD